MQDLLDKIKAGEFLQQAEAERAMHALMNGSATAEQIAEFLLGLRSRGESTDELVAFTKVMREYAVKVACPDEAAIDLCGTGGDGVGTFNISTTATFVCAGAGVTVAKHGNKSISSNCGSSDVLESLGVKTTLHKAGVEYCLEKTGLAFIFAPYFHPALKHVMPVRRSLGVRTFFNILGPMCNPADVKRQLVGAFTKDVAIQMAEILGRLGSTNVVTVHSQDGMDELSISADTDTFTVGTSPTTDASPNGTGTAVSATVSPASFGIPIADPADLRGGSADDNAQILRSILSGEKGSRRDIVLLNAAFALATSGRFGSAAESFDAAVASIDSGSATNSLNKLIAASNDAPTG